MVHPTDCDLDEDCSCTTGESSCESEMVKPDRDPDAELLLQAADILGVDADSVALPLTSDLLRALGDWLAMTAEQMELSKPEFSMVPYPTGHASRAMRIAIIVKGDG